MVTVYLGLGGNIGDTRCHIHKAVELLCCQRGIEGLQLSSLYLSEAVSPIEQRDFINGVCVFQTTLSPHELLQCIQAIEQTLGKVPKLKQAPRIIDLDILLYGSVQMHVPGLQIPHPYWRERLFVLLPLAELTASVFVQTDVGMLEISINDLLETQCQLLQQKIRLLLPEERIETCTL